MIFSKIAKNLRSRDWGDALVEVCIVVLGILIAVQVEQYRQFLSDRDIERKLLAEIASDLKATRVELLDDRGVLREKVIEINRLLTGLTAASEDPVLGDAATLFAVLSQETLFPKKSGYENLLNIGFSIISDPAIRQDLTNFYEVRLSNLITSNLEITARTEDRLTDIFAPAIRIEPVLAEATSLAEDSEFAVQVTHVTGIGDVRGLAENPTVVPLLHYRALNLRVLARQYQEAVQAIDQITEDIQAHLATL